MGVQDWDDLISDVVVATDIGSQSRQQRRDRESVRYRVKCACALEEVT